MRDIVNERVKYREGYRPFGGSVIAEAALAYFEMYAASPFMLEVCRVLPHRRSDLPAITHVDGTCRPHTVERTVNPQYWALLTEFAKLTGHPVVLNTSFNVAGEPIVCTPDDAVRCFCGSGLDTLVIGSYVVRKEQSRAFGGFVDTAAAVRSIIT